MSSEKKFAELTTMGVGGGMKKFLVAKSAHEIRTICMMHADEKIFVLGRGSNTLAHDEYYDGLVLKNEVLGVEVLFENDDSVAFRVGSGENWDTFVALSVQKNLSGIEAMSKIPGTVGAAPVQNIGAYGQEISEVFLSLEAYDRQTDAFVKIEKNQCEFAYRHSIFRGKDAGRYIIFAVNLLLKKTAPQPPFYAPIEAYFSQNTDEVPTPKKIREIVSAIREDKLPDPALYPNSGSFFKNAVVSSELFSTLQKQFQDIPHFSMPNSLVKIPTGWLIEKAGFKGAIFDDISMRVNDKNALVLINNGTKRYQDVAAARERIITAVFEKFAIKIEQEPLEVV